LRQAIQINKNWGNINLADAYYNRGVIKHDNLKDYQGAIADYNQAIKLKPDFTAAYNNRGASKANLGDNQGAITDLRQAIQINKNWGNRSLADAYNDRGIIKTESGDNQGAIADYNQAIKIKPDVIVQGDKI
jgi:tetratricopeptide (TPR) repeat protein